MAKKRSWKMPKWMEPYRELIVNTGGNAVEEMAVDDSSPLINLPRSTLAACVKSQIALLQNLHDRGFLAKVYGSSVEQSAASSLIGSKVT